MASGILRQRKRRNEQRRNERERTLKNGREDTRETTSNDKHVEEIMMNVTTGREDRNSFLPSDDGKSKRSVNQLITLSCAIYSIMLTILEWPVNVLTAILCQGICPRGGRYPLKQSRLFSPKIGARSSLNTMVGCPRSCESPMPSFLGISTN